MQFKNPEIFYFLALLLIPILVHLFQLQKFKKTLFTNVFFLQKIIQETRKSSQLKKWIILALRTLMYLAILFCFSQPYLGKITTNNKHHTYIYLDNSLSTNAKGERGDLLQISAKEIIENLDDKNVYSLQTNSEYYEKISKKKLREILLNLKNTTKKLNLLHVFLKIESLKKKKTKTLYSTVLISDFQYNYKTKFTNVTPSFTAIKLEAVKKNNISIDSIFISNKNIKTSSINIILKNQGISQDNIPISIFNNSKLLNKQSFSIKENTKKTIQFPFHNQNDFKGKINITFSDTFSFDNTLFFNLNTAKKTDVLSIGKDASFLSKIYTKNEFNFTSTSVKNLNYNSITKQQLIILNELENIPETISESLINFSKNGGNLVIIPNVNSNINSYNAFLKKITNIEIKTKENIPLKITTINYNHPLLNNVFSKKVTNFQYPKVESHYPIYTKNNSPIISFENNKSFISQIKSVSGTIYWVASSLNKKNSNFLKSPLIVPVFYNFGKTSFKQSQLYYRLDTKNKIDIEANLKNDEILTIANTENSIIPVQQNFNNKVSLFTNDQLLNNGFYKVMKKNDTLKTLAFNYPKNESLLNFLDLNELQKVNKNITISSSIKETLKNINNKNEVSWLWKWFLALAIVSLFLEILILKFYKP